MREIAVYESKINARRSNSQIEVLSLVDGTILNTVVDSDVVAIFDDFHIRYENGGLCIHKSYDDVTEIELPYPITEATTETMYFDSFDTTLLIYRENRVDAIDVESGAEVWSIFDTNLTTPILYDEIMFYFNDGCCIRVYYAMSGEEIGEIVLDRDIKPPSGLSPSLAISDNIIAIVFRDLQEVIVIRFNLQRTS
jgi:hypothetical protein